MNSRRPVLVVVWVLLWICTSWCHAEDHIYYGLLHAHTMYSDGSGLPEDAYKRAQDSGLQFFAVTPHNHAEAEAGAKERRDGLLIATDHALYTSHQPMKLTRHLMVNGQPQTQTIEHAKSIIQAAEDATSGSFVAIYGQEFSTISAGNHVNVLGYPTVLEEQNGHFDQLYHDLDQYVAKGHPIPVVQLNHPDVHGDLFYRGSVVNTLEKMNNDYGLDDYGGDFAALVAATD